MDLVAFGEQELGKIGSVLAGDEGFSHARGTLLFIRNSSIRGDLFCPFSVFSIPIDQSRDAVFKVHHRAPAERTFRFADIRPGRGYVARMKRPEFQQRFATGHLFYEPDGVHEDHGFV